jgi:type I restriction enzyme, S subunit
MELKPGYKHTEVGVIPEDWEVRRLIECCNKITDGTHDTPTPVSTGFPFLTAIHIKEDGIDYEGCLHLTKTDHDIIYARCNPQNGDVLMVNIGAGVATTATVTVDYEFSLKNVALLKPTKQRFSGDYLNYALINNKPKITQALSTGGAQPFLSLTQIGEIRIPTPPLPEQRAIATALSEVDGLIRAQEQLIAKKRDLKQAAMQQLLTAQHRLPGFSGDWVTKRLGEICEIGMGRTPSRLIGAFWGKGYKWLSIADLKTKVVSDSNEEITELAASEMSIIPKGTLLMSFKLSIGRLCFAGCDLFTNEAICSFKNLRANSDFLYYVLSRTDFSLYGKQAVKGATLNKESLKIIEVRLPPLPEQTAIAEVLSDMDEELAALETRLAKTRALKQGMMQSLLTGRIRLV